MKKLLYLSLALISALGHTQPNTEVYLLDMEGKEGKIELLNLRNISNNEGYDNQPSFYDDYRLLFSSTRNGQTDIALYNYTEGTTEWLCNTPDGSEYSPLKIPNKDAFSAIRLDTDGLQRLYEYDLKTATSRELLTELKVGYHVWYDEDIIVCSVLVEDRMDLVVANLKDNSRYTVQKNVGRSLHKIPKTDMISFVSKEKDEWSVKSLHPITGATNEIITLFPKGEDLTWSPDGSMYRADNRFLLKFNPTSDKKWNPIWRFEESDVNGVSRLAISPNGKKIALVSNESPSKIVQRQVDSYNAGDLDAFVNCYAENVVVRNFPADTLYVGHEKMRQNYHSLSPDKKVYEVEVVKRIAIGNQIIDHERVTGNDKIQMQVALYEVDNGKISSMTFIFDDTNASDPEAIVQQQLGAYNARDIDAFLETYTDDVQLYNFPAEKRSQGKASMHEGYANFFESTPDLNCEIKNRMVIGNKVIDEEFITANGNNFGAVAIYEVVNGKIAKVTFLR